MLDSSNLLELIKRASLDVVEAGDPADYCFGKVIGTNPLKILVEQKMVLGEPQLLLTRNVTNHKVQVSVGWTTGLTTNTDKVKGKDKEFESHSHAVSGREMIINNALLKGETVILLKKKGGQQYLVLDRVVAL